MTVSIRLGERSSEASAVTSWDGRLYVAWTGRDLRVNVGSAPGGGAMEGKRRLSARSYRERSSSDSMNNTIPLPPSVAGAGGRLLLAWTNPNWSVGLATADPYGEFSGMPVKARSWLPPALTATPDGDAGLIWIGTDRRVNLLRVWSGQRTTFEEAKSGTGAAVCNYQDELVVAWTGGDRRVNLLSVREGRSLHPMRLDEAKTDAPPAVCGYGDGLMVAWTGSDRRINLVPI